VSAPRRFAPQVCPAGLPQAGCMGVGMLVARYRIQQWMEGTGYNNGWCTPCGGTTVVEYTISTSRISRPRQDLPPLRPLGKSHLYKIHHIFPTYFFLPGWLKVILPCRGALTHGISLTPSSRHTGTVASWGRYALSESSVGCCCCRDSPLRHAMVGCPLRLWLRTASPGC